MAVKTQVHRKIITTKKIVLLVVLLECPGRKPSISEAHNARMKHCSISTGLRAMDAHVHIAYWHQIPFLITSTDKTA